MGLFKSMFGKKVAEAKQNVAKIENRDLMQAIVGIGVIVAHADDGASDEEIKVLEGIIATNDALKHFGSEITETVLKFHDMMKASSRMGRLKIMREVEDVKADQKQKEEVLVTALSVAEADGNISPKEMEVLKECASKLGMNLQSFLA